MTKCKRCAITVADTSRAKARRGVNDFDAVLPVDTLVALALTKKIVDHAVRDGILRYKTGLDTLFTDHLESTLA
jgi:hypothetical protein